MPKNLYPSDKQILPKRQGPGLLRDYVAVGDIVQVPKFFFDSSGEEYIGGASRARKHTPRLAACARGGFLRDEKKGSASGEISWEEAGIDAVQGAIGGSAY